MTSKAGRLRITVAIALGAMLLPVLPASATHSLAITHAPQPATVAGGDLEVSAAISSTCITLCLNIQMVAHYQLPTGAWDSKSTNGPASPSQVLTVTIPGSAIAAPRFTYWLEAIQYQERHHASARTPEFTIISVNRLNAIVKRIDGNAASGARYHLKLVDTCESTINLISVADGSVQANGAIEIDVPVDPPTQNAGLCNNGAANYLLVVSEEQEENGQTISRTSVDGFYALVGPTVNEALSGGIWSAEQKVLSLAHQLQDLAGPCPDRWRIDADVPRGTIGWIHHDFGMKAHYGFARTSDWDVGLKADFDNDGSFTANGEVHLGNDTGFNSLRVIPHDRTFISNYGPYVTETAVGTGVYTEVWQEYVVRENPDGSFAGCQAYPQVWAVQVRHAWHSPGEPLPMTAPHAVNQADKAAAPTAPGYWDDYYEGSYYLTRQQDNRKIGGQICPRNRGASACLEGRAGYSSLSQIRMDYGPVGNCERWWAYGGLLRDFNSRGTTPLETSEEIYADAGEPGNNDHLSGGIWIPVECS